MRINILISGNSRIKIFEEEEHLLNRSGERGHPCLVPDLSRKALSFCPLSVMLAVGLSYNEVVHLQACAIYFAGVDLIERGSGWGIFAYTSLCWCRRKEREGEHRLQGPVERSARLRANKKGYSRRWE